MNTKKTIITVFGLVLISFVIGIYFYPQMPSQMASHWNAQGEVDGYMSKFLGLFLMPFINIGLALLFIIIPKIDPLKENIEKFRKYYNWFVILFFVFMLSLYIQTILWNLGIEISPNIFLPISLGLLFFYTGVLCENTKKNWFIGIRTPWTLSSERVWERTNKLGGKLFKIIGVFALFGAVFEKCAVFFIFIPVILILVYIVTFSYFEYQKEV